MPRKIRVVDWGSIDRQIWQIYHTWSVWIVSSKFRSLRRVGMFRRPRRPAILRGPVVAWRDEHSDGSPTVCAMQHWPASAEQPVEFLKTAVLNTEQHGTTCGSPGLGPRDIAGAKSLKRECFKRLARHGAMAPWRLGTRLGDLFF